jgi:hypothetical protein
MPVSLDDNQRWRPYIDRIARGEWRSVVLRDMILDDIASLGLTRPAMMDIGCGHGFDMSTELQRSLADVAGEYIGIEPDPEITLQPFITRTGLHLVRVRSRPCISRTTTCA